MANDEKNTSKTSSTPPNNPNTPSTKVEPLTTQSVPDGGKESDTAPAAKTNEQRPEPNVEPVPTYRADMGEGLPPQKDQLNPDRAK